MMPSLSQSFLKRRSASFTLSLGFTMTFAIWLYSPPSRDVNMKTAFHPPDNRYYTAAAGLIKSKAQRKDAPPLHSTAKCAPCYYGGGVADSARRLLFEPRLR
jgi:hypothetical protein